MAQDLVDVRDEQVDVALLQEARQGSPVLEVELEAEAGMALEDPAGDLPDPHLGGVGPRTNRELAGVQIRRLVDRSREAVERVDDLPRRCGDEVAEDGGDDALAVPVEERHAATSLELLDALRQRRLAQAEHLRGLPEAPLLDQRQHVPELADFHVDTSGLSPR